MARPPLPGRPDGELAECEVALAKFNYARDLDTVRRICKYFSDGRDECPTRECLLQERRFPGVPRAPLSGKNDEAIKELQRLYDDCSPFMHNYEAAGFRWELDKAKKWGQERHPSAEDPGKMTFGKRIGRNDLQTKLFDGMRLRAGHLRRDVRVVHPGAGWHAFCRLGRRGILDSRRRHDAGTYALAATYNYSGGLQMKALSLTIETDDRPPAYTPWYDCEAPVNVHGGTYNFVSAAVCWASTRSRRP